MVQGRPDSIAVQVDDIAALKVREFSRAKTAAASGEVTIGVLIAIMVSSVIARFDDMLQ